APVLSLEDVIGRAGIHMPTPAPAPSAPLERRVSRVRRFAAWLAPVAAVLVIIVLAVTIFSPRSTPTGSVGPAPDVITPLIGRYIYALKASDGTVLWQSLDSDPITAPTSNGGIVYDLFYSNGDAILVALLAGDGSVLWESKPIPVIIPRIAVANG